MTTKSMDLDARRMRGPQLEYPLREFEPSALLTALRGAMKSVGQKQGAKGGNDTKQIRLYLRWPGAASVVEIGERLAGEDARSQVE